MPKFITPSSYSPTISSWQDMDLTSDLGGDAGSVKIAFFQCVTASASDGCGVRANGSSDSFLFRHSGGHSGAHAVTGVLVDSNDVVEGFRQNGSDEIWLIGYATDAEADGWTNAKDKSTATTGSWVDVDISSDTGADTATVAIGTFVNTSLFKDREYGWRANGSTDDTIARSTVQENVWQGVIVNLDGSEIFEQRISNANSDLYINGYLTDNATGFTNRKDYQENSTTGSYVDVDFSSDIPSGNVGAFCGIDGSELGFALRKNGSTFDEYHDVDSIGGWIVEIDGDRVAEQKVESASVDLYLMGYVSEPTSGHTGTATPTIEALAVDAVGVAGEVVTATPEIQTLVVDAVGEMLAEGVATPILQTLVVDAVGEMLAEGVATATPEIQTLAVDAVGEMLVEGVATPILQTMAVDAVGEMQLEATGAPTLEELVVTAVGEQPHEGVGVPIIQDVTVVSTGVQKFLGTGSPILQTLSIDSTGVLVPSGISSPLIEELIITAVSESPHIGTGNIVLQNLIVIASGTSSDIPAAAAEGVRLLVRPGRMMHP